MLQVLICCYNSTGQAKSSPKDFDDLAWALKNSTNPPSGYILQSYLEMRHEPSQIQQLLRTPDVNVDGPLQFLVEPDSCCNVEHNVHFLTEHLTVTVFDTQVGQPAVTRYKSHFVHVVGTGLLHEVEQLNTV